MGESDGLVEFSQGKPETSSRVVFKTLWHLSASAIGNRALWGWCSRWGAGPAQGWRGTVSANEADLSDKPSS